jgi:hypothetical protein
LIETAGSPFAQGQQQGRRARDAVRAGVAEARARSGWLAWIEAGAEAHGGAGRRARRFLPQQHERLQGIASGAGCRLRALELLAVRTRVAAVASRFEGTLEARFALPAALAGRLLLRSTRPEAVGFPSVELVTPCCAGALAGVNAAGVAVAVLAERGGPGQVPVRLLAQDVLLRGADLARAVEHLRLRARYAGGTGAIALLDARGDAARVEFFRGALDVHALVEAPSLPAETDVLLDPARRELTRFAPAGPPEHARVRSADR